MNESSHGRLIQRLTLLSVFALVFSFMGPAMPALGSELDTSGEVHQESVQEPEGNSGADVPADNSAPDPGSDGSKETEGVDGSAESDTLDDQQGDGSADGNLEGSSAGQVDDPNTGTDDGSSDEQSTENGDNADEAELDIVLQADDSEPQMSLLVLEGDGEGDSGILAQPQSSIMALTPTGLQPVHDTPENVVAVLVSTGITYSSITYTGSTQALGTFSGGDGIIGFPDGVLIGTGNIMNVVGPNTGGGVGDDLDEPGDPILTELADQSTNDAAVLSFEFVPTGNNVEFQYVFSSEEYNEYVGDFNDVFAFYVNGQNCATVGGQPVSVNTINNDSNSALYVDNTDGHLDTQMDGLTVVLTCTAMVNPGQTNTMQFMIADAGDGILDSHVFLQAKSFTIVLPDPVVPDPVDPAQPDKDPVEKPVKHEEKAKSGDKVTYEAAQVSGLPSTGTGTATQGYLGLVVVALMLSLGALAAGSLRAYNRR